MAASVEYRQEEMSCGDAKVKETSDDLSLFVDFSGANLTLDLLQKSNQIHVTSDHESENPLKPETVSIIHGQDSGSEDLLNSLNNITDYEWLLSPRRHMAPSSEMEEQMTLTDDSLISNGKSTSPESKLEDTPVDGTSTTNISPKLPATTSNGVKSSTTIRRPSPSPGSRSATPTTRPTLTKPQRSSTPTSRATVTASTKAAAPIKTPTPRAPPPVTSKSTSRSSPPIQRSSTLPVTANAKSASRPSNPGNRCSSAVKSRPLKNPPEMVNRSASACRARTRTGPPAVKVAVTEMNLKAVPKRTHGGVKPGMMRGRGDDDVNPVLMGTKMVERVVNMRKLAPPRQEDVSNQNNMSGKLSVSQDNSGFGRSLSKKSFDMALRHLDIRRSMPGNMRASITKVPASSVYSVRPDSTKTRTVSASDSPLATSSSASSE